MRRWPGIVVVSMLIAGCRGRHEEPGTPVRTPVPAPAVAARAVPPAEAAGKQILFGDLHVHTTFSADAFIRSLPMLQGEGAHPPADACDFARFCSGLDFWSITDHAESISPQHWRETKESVRECNAVAGDPRSPDLVTYLGWEWTQVGIGPADHYGHKNVIFRDTAEDRVPRRPISALDQHLIGALRQRPPLWQRLRFPLLDFKNRQRYFDFGPFQNELAAVPLCPAGVDTRQLPEDCSETAHTPRELFEKLAQWGFDTLVIPHGNTWGLYTPPGSSWDKQLAGPEHDPARQTLIEVFSGHGNSEQYRDWHEVTYGPDGEPVCPPPSRDYLPCCWQAGELVRARCDGAAPAECERRVAAARTNYLRAEAAGRMTLPDEPAESWKDCGQCRDCFDPAFNYRPRSSVQYAMALTNFDDPAPPRLQGVRPPHDDRGGGRAGRGLARSRDRRAAARAGRRVGAVRSRHADRGPHDAPGPRLRARGVVLPDRRSRRGARDRPGPGRDLVRAHAARGLRHERPAHPPLVRPARPGRRPPDGLRDAPRSGAEVPHPRRRLLGAEAGLSGVVDACARARAPRLPLPRRVLQPVRRTTPHHAHRDRPYSPAGAAGRAGRPADRGPLGAPRLPAGSDGMRRRGRRSR